MVAKYADDVLADTKRGQVEGSNLKHARSRCAGRGKEDAEVEIVGEDDAIRGARPVEDDGVLWRGSPTMLQ